jgi:ferredoxin
MYKVTIRRRGPNACIGAGPCIVEAPDLFALDDDNLAYLKPGADTADEARLLRAARSCPVEAIVVDDEAGNRVFPK